MSRLFVAAWPPAHVCEHVREIARDGWTGVRWTPEENWHVTLRFLGEAEPAAVADALNSCAFPTATAEVANAPVTLGSHSLVLPVTGIDELARAVRRATAALGTHSPDERFRGHLTIGRAIGRRRIGREASPSGAPASATSAFEVTEIALVGSTLTPEGARYSTLARFPTVNVGGR